MKPINDNRKFPRVEHACDVTLKLPGNRNVKTDMFDISSDGLQIRFDKETAINISPVLGEIINNTTEKLDTEFSINTGTATELISVSCKPIYMHKIEKGLFAMGLQFKNMDNNFLQILQNYIESSMEPL